MPTTGTRTRADAGLRVRAEKDELVADRELEEVGQLLADHDARARALEVDAVDDPALHRADRVDLFRDDALDDDGARALARARQRREVEADGEPLDAFGLRDDGERGRRVPQERHGRPGGSRLDVADLQVAGVDARHGVEEVVHHRRREAEHQDEDVHGAKDGEQRQ